MDRSTDSNKRNTPTPRRTLGLRRISPQVTTKPSIKRTILQTITSPPTSTSNRTGESSSEKNEDNDSLVTPSRKRTSLGRFVFSPKAPNVHPTEKLECDEKTADQLKEAIRKMEAHLEQYEKYKIEKKELQHLIDVWTAGGQQSLTMLQEEIKPKQEIEQILTYLNIPIDIFGNNTNDD